MAITLCQECGGKVSTRAAACPHCGCPVEPASAARQFDADAVGERVVSKDANATSEDHPVEPQTGPQAITRHLTAGNRLLALAGTALVPGVWLGSWSLRPGPAFVDQVLYVAIGFVVAMSAFVILLVFRRPLQFLVALGSGALGSAIVRGIIFGLVGRYPESGLISSLALIGGAVGGVALWLFKGALSGTLHYTWDASS